MRYVFGNTLICNDSAAAKRVTFDKTIRQRTVTLEGDVFDPMVCGSLITHFVGIVFICDCVCVMSSGHAVGW